MTTLTTFFFVQENVSPFCRVAKKSGRNNEATEVAVRLACENIRFSSLFVAEDVSARNVLSDEERGETDVFAGYCKAGNSTLLGFKSGYPTNFKIIHMHSATIIRCFMRIYSLPVKSVKCTLNFSFKLIFSGFFVFINCFLVLLTRRLRRVYINGFFRNNGLSLR